MKRRRYYDNMTSWHQNTPKGYFKEPPYLKTIIDHESGRKNIHIKHNKREPTWEESVWMIVLSKNTLILEKKAVELGTLGNLGHLKDEVGSLEKCWDSRDKNFMPFPWIKVGGYRLDTIHCTTVEPLVRDHPKCKDWLVAYGRWSLTRFEPQGASIRRRGPGTTCVVTCCH